MGLAKLDSLVTSRTDTPSWKATGMFITDAKVRCKKNSVVFTYNLSAYSCVNYIICRLLIPCKYYINRCWYAANSNFAFGNLMELLKFLTRLG